MFMIGSKLILVLLASASLASATNKKSLTSATNTKCVNKVESFALVDASKNPATTTALVEQTPGPTNIYLGSFSTCELNIVAVTSSTPAGCNQGQIMCVKLQLGNDVRKERAAPYALYGDVGGNYYSKTPRGGVQTLKACTYTDSECKMNESGCKEFKVDVDGSSLYGLLFYSPTFYGGPFEDAPSGDTTEMCSLPLSSAIQIQVEAQRCAKKVDVKLTGTDGTVYEKKDLSDPFDLYSDGGGTFAADVDYTFTATPDNNVLKSITGSFKFLEELECPYY